MGDHFCATTCSLGGFGNESKDDYFPSNSSSYRGVDLAYSNNDLEEYECSFF